MSIIGERISINGEYKFKSLEDAKKAAQTHQGSEAIVEIKDGENDHYELRKITSDDNKKQIHEAKDLKGDVNFSNFTKDDKDTFIGLSIAESSSSKGNDIFAINPRPVKVELEFVDRESCNQVIDAVGEVKTKKNEEKKSKIIDKLVEKLPNYNTFTTEQKEKLKEFLKTISLEDLMKAEQQGSGGDAGSAGMVTGTGVDGHYVNSIISSIRHIMQDNRLTTQVLDSLNSFSKAKLAPELNDQKPNLIRSALQDISFPEKIAQHNKGTCAATSAQIIFAQQEPAKYIQVVEALAGPDGKVPETIVPKGTDNKPMARENDTLKDDKSGRNITCRLIQPAFMEYANENLDYDNKKDEHSNKEGGLEQPATNYLMNALLGKDRYKEVDLKAGDPKVFDAVQKHLTQKKEPVCAGMDWDDGAHEIVVVKTDKDNVYFMNPWGDLNSMPVDEFKKRLSSASVDPNLGPDDSSPDATAALPSAAKDKSNYKEIVPGNYMTVKDRVKYEFPAVATKIIDGIVAMAKALKFEDPSVSYSIEIAKDDKLIESALKRLHEIKNKDQASNFMNLAAKVNQFVKSGILTEAQGKDILTNVKLKDTSELADIYDIINTNMTTDVITKEKASGLLIIKDPSNAVLQTFKKEFTSLSDGLNLISAGIMTEDELKSDMKTIMAMPEPSKTENMEKLKELYSTMNNTLTEAKNLVLNNVISESDVKSAMQKIISSKDTKAADKLLNLYSAGNQVVESSFKLISKGVISQTEADVAKYVKSLIMAERTEDLEKKGRLYSPAVSIIDNIHSLNESGVLKANDIDPGKLLKSFVAESRQSDLDKLDQIYINAVATVRSAANLEKLKVLAGSEKDGVNKAVGDSVKAQKSEDLDKLNIYRNSDAALTALSDLHKKSIITSAKETEIKKFIKTAIVSGNDKTLSKLDDVCKLYISAKNTLDSGITFSGFEKKVISKLEVKDAVRKFLTKGSSDKLIKLQDIFDTFVLSGLSEKDKKSILDLAIKKGKVDEAKKITA